MKHLAEFSSLTWLTPCPLVFFLIFLNWVTVIHVFIMTPGDVWFYCTVAQVDRWQAEVRRAVMYRQVYVYLCQCQTGPEVSAAPSQTSLPSLFLTCCSTFKTPQEITRWNHKTKTERIFLQWKKTITFSMNFTKQLSLPVSPRVFLTTTKVFEVDSLHGCTFY